MKLAVVILGSFVLTLLGCAAVAAILVSIAQAFNAPWVLHLAVICGFPTGIGATMFGIWWYDRWQD